MSTPATAAAPGAVEATVTRLRPVVYASPTPRGLHVRGWSSSFTISGGAGLWPLWRALARRLADGIPLDEPPLPGAPEKLSSAVSLILAQLREHDMLVRVPAGWAGAGRPEPPDPDLTTQEQSNQDLPDPDLARWLESVAPDPAGAWRRLRAVRVTITGTGPAAGAAARALTGAGVAVDPFEAGPAGQLRLSGRGGPTVVAGCGDEAGYVLPVGHTSAVLAARVATRLGLAGSGGHPPHPLGALVGAAAAHRLVCALAGLPDPAADAAALADDGPASPVRADGAVLVARLDPLRATYHHWLPIAIPAAGPAANDLDLLSRRLDALGDPELGVLPEARHADLPQLPAMLAVAGDQLGVATTADGARLDAALRAAEQRLSTPDQSVVVGADLRHATGAALRRLADGAVRALPAAPIAEPEWAGSVVARRWWKTLTLRLAVAAELRVRRLGDDAVHAEILAGDARLAWAVEAEAADAVALAALAATGLVQARTAGMVVPGPVALAGAAPAWRPDHGPEVGWTGAAWSWPSSVADAEQRLQAGLRQALSAWQVELRPLPVAIDPDPVSATDELARALRATSFVALAYLARLPARTR